MFGKLHGKTWLRRGTALTVFGAAMALANPASAKDCAELGKAAIKDGKVTAATLVAPGTFTQPASPFGPPPGVGGGAYANLPEFCRIEATLTPTSDSDIKVEIWLPASGWNGKYVGIGNGIWAGTISYSQLAAPLAQGYAVASTDTGHEGDGMTGDFAVGHFEKFVDYGHRAIHLMTVTAKAMIREYYGEGPKLSYWTSCSTGGRQGVMEAFRYPEDYDAISVMAPANPMTDLMTQSMWVNWVTKRTPGAALTADNMAMIHKAAVGQCDKLDGLEDGIISRPEDCKFDPVSLLCAEGGGNACLSVKQVAAMRAIYEGVTDPRTGAQLLPGFPPGSELQLAMLVTGPQPFPVAYSYFDSLVHGGDDGWNWIDMDFGRETYIARDYGAEVLNVPYSGLGPFFARGGKLLLSHGWTDGLIPATNAVRFYRGLYHELPVAQAQEQLRMFMVPGMDHCAGGEGASQWDPLSVVDEWATSGTAPNKIIATRGGPGGFPGAPVLPPMSRPLCPYPLYPQYQGGDEDSAESFACVTPE